MRLRAVGAAALALVVAACAAATTTSNLGWQARHAAGEALREAVRFAEEPLPDAWTDAPVTATPVPINDPALEAGTGHLRYAGGVHITSDFHRLHGLSDLVFEDNERFYSISDEGLLVRGRIQLDADGRLTGVTGVQARPLLDPDGEALIPKYLADAEGLVLMPDGELLVSFERDHRVWRYDRETGRYLGDRAIPDFAFTENEGMEGIAVAGGDEYWASGENGGFWLCTLDGCESSADGLTATLTDDDLRVTSMDRDPNQPDVYWVLRRAYHADRNTNTISIGRRIVGAGTVSWAGAAVFTAPATVDNFEGIAAVRRPDGTIRLYILSDDNFSDRQRTLLLAFDVVR